MTDWRDEKLAVSEALAEILAKAKRPYLTMQLGHRLQSMTDIPEKRCRAILGWLANEGHAHATRDGGMVFTYGRSVVRWRWHPKPQRSDLEARLNKAGVVDTSDW